MATAPVLNQSSPPLSIEVKIKIKDVVLNNQNAKPDTIVRFGYRTPTGGSIPQNFQAVLYGLQDFFQPLEAIVRTDGLPGDKLTINSFDDKGSHYAGPLDLIGFIDHTSDDGRFTADLGLSYDPWPEAVAVRYAKDDAGDHITYRHGHAVSDTIASRAGGSDDIDLDATAVITKDGAVTNLRAQIERLPRMMQVDVKTDTESGTLVYAADSDGRRPDLGVDLTHRVPNERPLHVNMDVEGLPTKWDAAWTLPPEATPDTPLKVDFHAADGGIGAVEGVVTNFDTPTHTFQKWVSPEVQYVDYQRGPGEDPDMQVKTRIERIRTVNVFSTGDELDLHTDLGNGQRPLASHVVLSELGTDTKRDLLATAVISPLPKVMDAHIQLPPDDETGPIIIGYDASSPVDVDVHGEVRPFQGVHPCGYGETLCADVALRNLPKSIDVALKPDGKQLFFELDQIPQFGATPLDMFADVVAGPKAFGEFNEPLVGHVELQGIPRHIRARINRPADGVAPDAIEFHACNWNYAPDDPSCTQGAGDRIAQVDASLRNTLVRPANLPSLVPTAPLYATALGRGDVFEVVTHLVDVAEVQLALRQDVVGLRTDVGGGVPLQILADFEDLDLNKYSDSETELPIVDLDGAVLINPLPPVLNVCFRAPGAHGKTVDDFTTECQNKKPFGDEIPVNTNPNWLTYKQSDGPLSVAYDASDSPDDFAPFDVITDVKLVAQDVKIDPDGNDLLVDDLTVLGHLGIFDLPETLVSAHAACPMRTGTARPRCGTRPAAATTNRSTSTSRPRCSRATVSAKTRASRSPVTDRFAYPVISRICRRKPTCASIPTRPRTTSR